MSLKISSTLWTSAGERHLADIFFLYKNSWLILKFTLKTSRKWMCKIYFWTNNAILKSPDIEDLYLDYSSLEWNHRCKKNYSKTIKSSQKYFLYSKYNTSHNIVISVPSIFIIMKMNDLNNKNLHKTPYSLNSFVQERSIFFRHHVAPWNENIINLEQKQGSFSNFQFIYIGNACTR